MSLLSPFSSKKIQQTTTTQTFTDSFNTSQSATKVLEGLGNVTVSLPPQGDVERLLPLAFVALIGLGGLMLLRRS